MKKIISLSFTLILVFCLVACGGQNNSSKETANVGGQKNTATENQTTPSEQPEGEQEDEEKTADTYDESTTPPEEGEKKDEEQQENETQDETPVITASHSDVTLKAAGNSFVLQPLVVEGTCAVSFSSEDESIATVDSNGTVTAVAPGKTVVNMHIDCDGAQYAFSCIIRCNWTVEGEGEGENGEQDAPVSIDFNAFFSSYMEYLAETLGEENVPSVMAVEGELLDAYYPGLNDVTTKQCLVVMPGIGAVPFEFALIEVENADDMETIKGILQSRMDYQIEGGAWYPETVAAWEKAEIAASGNYIALIVAGEQQADAVAAFNTLFN